MEGSTVNQVELSLKLMVDSKANKVVFAEAGKDFVDFLLHMLTLPVATVSKLLSTNNLPTPCRSVESLSTAYFEPNVNKNTVLMPKFPVNQPLLSLNYTPNTITYYKCPDHSTGSCHSGVICGQVYTVCYGDRYRRMQEVKLTYVAPTSGNLIPGFVKDAVPYLVMDNLEVKPLSVTLIKSVVSDFDYLVEQDVKFGPKEALSLLSAAFTANNEVLTTIFREIKKENL